MDAISRERRAGLGFARQQRPAGSAFTGVALSNTLDNRTSHLCFVRIIAGLAIMRRARRVARSPTETPPEPDIKGLWRNRKTALSIHDRALLALRVAENLDGRPSDGASAGAPRKVHLLPRASVRKP